MANPTEQVYKNVLALLSVNASLLEKVPKANIFPSNDPGAQREGNLITYGFSQWAWDTKAKRGQGVLAINAESVANKLDSSAIMELVKGLLNARALTIAGTGIRVHLFKEQPETTDDPFTVAARFSTQSKFKIMLVEVPV
jgi:hypothetical protein